MKQAVTLMPPLHMENGPLKGSLSGIKINDLE